MKFLFRHFEVIRLQAELPDANGTLRVLSGRFYVKWLNDEQIHVSWVTRLENSFAFTEKSFYFSFSTLSTFEAVCLALKQILSLKIQTLLRSWEFLLLRISRDTHFGHQRRANARSKRSGVNETCTELCGTVDVRITVSFPTLFPVI